MAKWSFNIFNVLGKKYKNGLEPLEEVDVAVQSLKEILKQLAEGQNVINAWEQIIFNEEIGIGEDKPSLMEKGQKIGMMETYNKKWIALSLAIALYQTLLKDFSRFVMERPGVVARMRTLDPELARQIDSLQLPQKEASEVLGPLRGILNNPQLVISYIKTHYEDIMRKLDMFKDKEMANKLRKIVVALSDREVDELLKCANDARSWSYRVAYRTNRTEDFLNLFIERGSLFLIGGNSKYDGQAFLGFQMHFKDTELVKEMLKTPEIRRLLTYREEIEFFRRAKNAIEISLKTQSNWKGFFDFYDNLDSGKNYIKRVRERYGNEKFAKILKAFKKEKHQAIIDWEREFAELEEGLIKYAYQLVIEPAAQAFTRIFEARIRKLESEKGNAMQELQKLLSEPTLPVAKQFLKILAKKRRRLKVEIDEERHNFKLEIGGALGYLPDFVLYLSIVSKETDIEPLLPGILRSVRSLSNWQKFGLVNIRTTPASEDELLSNQAVRNSVATSLARGVTAMHKSIPAAEMEAKIKRITDANYQQSLVTLNEVIRVSEGSLLPEMIRYASYIKTKLEHEFVPEVNSILEKNNVNTQMPQSGKIVNIQTAGEKRKTGENETKFIQAA